METNNSPVELVPGINPDPAGSSLRDLTEFGDRLYFSADGGTGRELWSSDGTEAGTQLVKDINPRVGSVAFGSSPENLAEVNGQLYFSADNDANDGRELWSSDGTEAGTQLVKNINTNERFPNSSDPEGFTELNGKVYFSAISNEASRELWVTDGTTQGTQLVKDINPGAAYYNERRGFLAGSSNPSDLTEFNGKLYFSAAEDGGAKDQLWVTDGTEAGTQLVSNLISDSRSVSITDFASLNNELYFGVDGGGSFDLWVTDGTTAGTQQAVNIVGDFNASPAELTEFNGKLYFSASSLENGRELWVSDGTAEGTQLAADLNPGTESSRPNNLTEFNNKLYFSANDGVNGREIWVSDGTAQGTQLVADLNPGAGDSIERYLGEDNFAVAGNELFFVADNGIQENQLFKLTDNGSIVIEPTEPPVTGSLTFIGGTAGDDNLQGTAIDERIEGGAGNDILVGGAGNDILAAGSGVDIVTGGEGRDTFYLAPGARTNTFTDFELGSDFIGLAQGLTFEELSFNSNNIQLGNDVLTTLTGVETISLTPEDFTVL